MIKSIAYLQFTGIANKGCRGGPSQHSILYFVWIKDDITTKCFQQTSCKCVMLRVRPKSRSTSRDNQWMNTDGCSSTGYQSCEMIDLCQVENFEMVVDWFRAVMWGCRWDA